jgi:hypothetical protein
MIIYRNKKTKMARKLLLSTLQQEVAKYKEGGKKKSTTKKSTTKRGSTKKSTTKKKQMGG